MKTRILSFCIVCTLLLTFCMPAWADTSIAYTYEPQGRSVDFNLYNNTNAQIISEGSSTYYVLFDASGNPLTSDHYLMMSSTYGFWKVAVQEGINNVGLINGEGRVVMPLQYGAVEVISEKWAIGVALTPSTIDQYDYKSYDGENFYLVTAYDVYFDGVKVGSLDRTAYSDAYAHGNYLYVKDRAQDYHFYNSAFAESAYVAEYGSPEFDVIYKNGETSIWHKGSGQQAFVDGCTLTSEEVDLDIYQIDGKFYDLQGNIVFEFTQYYDYFSDFEGDYARFRAHDKYGLIDRNGNVVLAAEYDEINSYSLPNNYNLSAYFPCGYQAVVKDGKVGYVDLNGNVTCEFKYSASNVKYSMNPNFATIQDLDGSYIILTAAAGELAERYTEVYVPGGWSTCISAENADGLIGVIDMEGEEVLPFNSNARSTSSYSFARDGSGIALSSSGNVFYYSLESRNDASNEPGEENLTEVIAAAEPEVQSSNTWTCECGAVSDGNFCPNCGSQRPEEKVLTCTNCGYQPATEETPNFCPQCGQKFGE